MELAKLKLKSVSPTRQLENISFSDSILDFNTTVLQQKNLHITFFWWCLNPHRKKLQNE